MTHFDYVYAELVNGLIGGLLQRLLILGLFFVLYGYLRLLVKIPGLILSKSFLKRVVLLGSVTLFIFYVSLTYFMEYASLGFDEVIEQIHSYDSYEMSRSKIALLVMVPIDLLSITLLAGMYATLGLESLESSDLERSERLEKVLRNLFFITGSWHLITVIWWVAFGLLTNRSIDGQDVLYHGSFALLHYTGFILQWKSGRFRNLSSIGVGIYSLLLMTVYASRIWMYVDRL